MKTMGGGGGFFGDVYKNGVCLLRRACFPGIMRYPDEVSVSYQQQTRPRWS